MDEPSSDGDPAAGNSVAGDSGSDSPQRRDFGRAVAEIIDSGRTGPTVGDPAAGLRQTEGSGDGAAVDPCAKAGTSASPRSQSFRQGDKVRSSADYQQCYRAGIRLHGSLFILYFAPGSRPRARLGITASRKVGKATVRQKTKRRIREIYRRWSQRSQLPICDVVIHVRPGAGTSSFDEARRDLERLLGKLVRRHRA